MKQKQKIEPHEADSNDDMTVLALCPCGRAPKRKGQRNCHLCNAEANKRHRARVRRKVAAFETMIDRLRGA